MDLRLGFKDDKSGLGRAGGIGGELRVDGNVIGQFQPADGERLAGGKRGVVERRLRMEAKASAAGVHLVELGKSLGIDEIGVGPGDVHRHGKGAGGVAGVSEVDFRQLGLGVPQIDMDVRFSLGAWAVVLPLMDHPEDDRGTEEGIDDNKGDQESFDAGVHG